MSDVPALGELARRATAVIDAREAGTAIPPDDRATPEFQAYCLALVAFREAATPDAVLQLVALAAGFRCHPRAPSPMNETPRTCEDCGLVPDSSPPPVPSPATTPAPMLLQRLIDRVALLDRIIGEHHDSAVMREENDVCPVCMAAGGTDFFATTGALLREARHAR
jgi:hypothetical protein